MDQNLPMLDLTLFLNYSIYITFHHLYESIHNSGAKNIAIQHLQKSLYLFYLFTPNINGSIFLAI